MATRVIAAANLAGILSEEVAHIRTRLWLAAHDYLEVVAAHRAATAEAAAARAEAAAGSRPDLADQIKDPPPLDLGSDKAEASLLYALAAYGKARR